MEVNDTIHIKQQLELYTGTYTIFSTYHLPLPTWCGLTLSVDVVYKTDTQLGYINTFFTITQVDQSL